MSYSGDLRTLVLLFTSAAVLFPACQRDNSVVPQKPAATDAPKERSGERTVVHRSRGADAPVPVVTASGRELYLQHCAACHGEFGDGDGIAAPHLHPRPRNFRGGQFLLVSTESRFPSVEDLEAVMVRGMPGSAMPPFAHLSQEERRRLADEVLRLCRAGLRDSFVQSILKNENVTLSEIDEEELEVYVSRRTDPGPETEVPEVAEVTSASIESGKELYFKKNCQACHGQEGKGDGKKDMLDQYGLPTKPRDFTRGIFKGGYDPQSLYRRIAYGMPGSAMPSHWAVMTPDEIYDVVHYILSLSDESMREAAILRRNRIVAKYVEELPSSTDSDAWSGVEPTQLRMTPLQWRHGADPDLSVKALHDGEEIVFRLTWRDETADQPKFDDEQFADIAALELYRGEAEPFIGMGNFASPVDVWRWTARVPPPPRVVPTFSSDSDSSDTDEGTTSNTDQKPGESPVEESKEADSTEPPTSETDSEATETEEKVRVLSVDEQRRLSGAITGYGAGTFALEFSQLVHSKGRWQDNAWTVELRRPLRVKNNLFGVSLEPGCDASVAFAIWNGSEGDHGGRKAITIWQDLHVEAQPKQ